MSYETKTKSILVQQDNDKLTFGWFHNSTNLAIVKLSKHLVCIFSFLKKKKRRKNSKGVLKKSRDPNKWTYHFFSYNNSGDGTC